MRRFITLTVITTIMRFTFFFVVAVSLALSAPTCAQGPDVELVDAFPELSFTRPVELKDAGDGTNILYVAEQAGRIISFENDDKTETSTVFLDITSQVASGGEMGFLGLVFDPDHANNGHFFVNYTVNNPRRTRVSRFTRDTSNPEIADPTSEVVMFEVGQTFSNHNAGAVMFGPDGYLYVPLGDGGSGGDPNNEGQTLSTLLGSILRLDVNGGGNPLDCASGTGAATIPADNPFVDGTGGNCDEAYAYGFRNPFRASFDPETDIMWVGDVGQGSREEVSNVNAGENHGWRMYEGNSCHSAPCDPTGMTFPRWDYPHSNGNFSVTGGYIYHGTAIEDMDEMYVYGDLGGRIWAVDVSVEPEVHYDIASVSASKFCAGSYCLASMGLDADGEIYALPINDQIQKIILSTTSANEENPEQSSTSLGIVGPNPVRDNTTLRINSSAPTTARLSVVDLLGREVALLFDGALRQGATHDVVFDTTALPTGVYVARLESGETTSTVKLSVVH